MTLDIDASDLRPNDNRPDLQECFPTASSDTSPGVPSHIVVCQCDNHTGRCRECNGAITIGPSGTEYGHHRGYPARDGRDDDCPHRPEKCNPPRGRWQR